MKTEKSRFTVGSWVKRFDGTIGMTVVNIATREGEHSENNQIRCRFKSPEGSDREETFKEIELVEL